MKIIYGISKIKKYLRPVVALGVFDGVHRGHRRVLESLAKKARRIRGTSMVLTFWPDPHRQKCLYSLQHRLKLIRDIGIDVSVVVKFTESLARIPAQDFIEKILVRKINPCQVYVGKNFRFGRAGQGSYRTLKKYSRIHKFGLKAFSMLKAGGRPVSSTYIRSLIGRGKLALAERLLSRRVNILGTVTRGNALGRKLGFPTANINPHHEVMPPSGVYLVEILLGNKVLKGICNIGFRPTFSKKQERRVEVHIFDFKRNIYGRDLEIRFLRKLRKERKFASGRLLARQIQKDILLAKKILSLHR